MPVRQPLVRVMRNTARLLLVMSSSAFAQVGFYKSSEPPGIARRWSEMCIQQTATGSFNVRLFGGYCPNEKNECANMRFDELSFESTLKKGVLLHRAAGCTLAVVAGKKSARVTQKGHCSQYDLLAGRYVKRASEVWQDDCSPIGGSNTHHD